MKQPLPLLQQERITAFVETARELARTVVASVEAQSSEAGALIADELANGGELAVVLSLQPRLELRVLLVPASDEHGLQIGDIACDERAAGAVMQ